jgi:AAA+ ATPase superfamily predicted ATPase
MQGIVLNGDAPLFGRAMELFQVRPLHPRHIREALGSLDGLELLDAWTAWGGVPRYLALAAARGTTTRDCVDALVLDPGGLLHDDVARQLLEESPPATDLRATLDVIGGGAHRVSEIAGRMGRPATALGRPLERLQGLELIARETPFGTPERDTKRSLYRLTDPFFRLWFRCVSPHRGFLLQATAAERRELLAHHWPALRAEAFEQLCRMLLPGLRGGRGWGVAQRWWQGSEPELDVVAASRDGDALLVGEVRALAKALNEQTARKEVQGLLARPVHKGLPRKELERVLFVPRIEKGCPRRIDGVWLVEMNDLVEGRWPSA